MPYLDIIFSVYVFAAPYRVYNGNGLLAPLNLTTKQRLYCRSLCRGIVGGISVL